MDTAVARSQIALLRGLRAVRSFRPDPVPQQVIDDLLEVARWTGSARNEQPWELVVVHDRATIDALANCEGTAKHLLSAPLAIVQIMAGRDDRNVQEIYDDGRLAERIMLAAAAHGVGSCIGWFKGDGMTEAKTLLGIPQERLVRTALSLGYPDGQDRANRPNVAQPRKPLAEIAYSGRYGEPLGA